MCIDSFGSAEGAFDPDFSLDSDWQHHWRTAASCTLSIHSLEGTEHNSFKHKQVYSRVVTSEVN